MRRYYKKGTLFGCFIIFYISCIIKFLQYKVLPDKYFYDSNAILRYMNGNYIADKSYNFTAKFFDTINIFNFKELVHWSVFFSIIFTIILFFLIIQNYEYNIKQYIFIYTSIILLNIYVFNLSKDIIQFIIFFIIYIVIINKKLNNKIKIFLISIILIYEAINFRIYYIIMLTLVFIIYFLYKKIIKNNVNTKNSLVKILLWTITLFIVEIAIVKVISKESYIQIVTARSGVNAFREGSIDAVTIINDMIKNDTNYLLFILNYIINIFRIMFPIELITKGIKYIPFIIYQFFVTINIFNLGKKLDNNNILLFAINLSFIMISTIFEPDFGSLIRHESALTLLILQTSIINENMKIKDNVSN